MTRIARTLVFLLVVSVVGACHGNAPSETLDGLWRGTIVDSVSGNGSIEVTLKGRGPGVSGTWTARFNVSGETRTGTLSGTLIGSTVALVLSYDAPMVCAGGEKLESRMAFDGTLAGTDLSGPYAMLVCSGVRTGTIDVVHQ